MFYLGLQLLGGGPPTLERAICSTQSLNLNVRLTQKCPRRIRFDQISGHVMAELGCCIKLTITVSKEERLINCKRDDWYERGAYGAVRGYGKDFLTQGSDH